MRRARTLLTTAAFTLVVGCSGSSGATGATANTAEASQAMVSATPSSSPSPSASMRLQTSTAEPPASDSHAAGHHESVDVAIRDFAFQPEAVSAGVGQTIRWTNEDGEPHTVRSDDGSISSAIISGEPFEWTVEGAPGTRVAYACSIHPQMEGFVDVTE